MLALLRCGRASGALGTHGAQLSTCMLAAETSAALGSQGYFTAAAASAAVTNLRLFDVGRAAVASETSSVGRAVWQQSAGSALRHISTSAICQQAASEFAAPAAGSNPLQSLAAQGNPLSAVPTAAAQERQRIATATLRHAKISPQKLSEFVRVVQKMHVEEALLQCQASVKKASKMVFKLLESARANGEHNHGLDPSRLYVETLLVGKARTLRRVEFKGRGRVGKIHKRRSHMTVVLRELEGGQAPPRKVARIFPPYLERLRMRKQ